MKEYLKNEGVLHSGLKHGSLICMTLLLLRFAIDKN